MSELRTVGGLSLRQVVNRQIVIKLKYYPNQDGQQRIGWRTVLPLDLYTYRGIQYILCWFTGGSSVSGGSGYRLFFTQRIHEIQETDTTTQQPFALRRELLASVKQNYKVMAWVLLKTGKIE